MDKESAINSHTSKELLTNYLFSEIWKKICELNTENAASGNNEELFDESMVNVGIAIACRFAVFLNLPVENIKPVIYPHYERQVKLREEYENGIN